ncbi:hypothetical protein [Hymenobacter jeollabukensis]|uniref:DUF3592 domain-containing protein n=1 Tax=Hymenobacter jeollabukensis TaxID=2025313 RepID=A0A5R8WWX8_9BACT|nr:hypothetical protein [Hymenobacter jeollabukensis]TLM96563.1 hypothetical protein FDY95_00790 [Hymenobacter jeollabukensis]
MHQSGRLFAVGLLIPLLLALAGLLGYRGSRTLGQLTQATGPVEHLTLQPTASGSRASLLLYLQLRSTAEPLRYNFGRNSRATQVKAQALVEQLQRATRITAYFDSADVHPFLYQLEADGQILISARAQLILHRLGCAAMLTLALLSTWALRRGLTARRALLPHS